MQAVILLLFFLVFGSLGGCSHKTAKIDPAIGQGLAVLTSADHIQDQSDDQAKELHRVAGWLDRDLLKVLKKSGFRPMLIKDMQEYSSEMGKLFIVDFERFDPGSRTARAFIGFGAGAASLDLQYKLLDEQGDLLAEWRDGAGSSKGATYCAETLNKRAVDKIVGILSKR